MCIRDRDALADEIDRIGDSTKFNGIDLLNGGSMASDGIDFQIGANNADYESCLLYTSMAVHIIMGRKQLLNLL